MQRFLLCIIAFCTAFCVAFFGPAIIEKLAHSLSSDSSSFSKVEYHPGYLNRWIELQSPDGNLTASAGEAGMRQAATEDKSGDAVDKITIRNGATPIFELLHQSDSYTDWRELSSLEWSDINTVVFAHQHPDNSSAKFSVTVNINNIVD